MMPVESLTHWTTERTAANSGLPHALDLPVRHPPPYNASDMWQLWKEFLLFLRQEKKWWLIPLVLLLLILGALILFSSGSVLAPLMYPFM
jgi:hypothetical protein